MIEHCFPLKRNVCTQTIPQAVACSLNVTRALDASRMVTMACIAAVADAVMRCRCSDVPSELCEHYAGRARGNGQDSFLSSEFHRIVDTTASRIM